MTTFWSSFKDELVATAVVLVITAGASFYVADRLSAPPALVKVDADTLKTLGASSQGAVEEQPEEGGAQTQPEVTPTPRPTPSPTPVTMTQVVYGEGGTYDNDYFKLDISNPRLEFDSRDNSKRKVILNVVLANKSVAEGLVNRLTTRVVKDGLVIVPEAAMSVSESKTVMPGQKLTFVATLALIAGTDANKVMFTPPGVKAAIVHTLYAVAGATPGL